MTSQIGNWKVVAATSAGGGMSVQAWERFDGARVASIGSASRPWYGFGPSPHKDCLLSPKERQVCFATARAAKDAVDHRWPVADDACLDCLRDPCACEDEEAGDLETRLERALASADREAGPGPGEE